MTTDANLIWLAEMVVYDPSIPGTRTLRYSTGLGFVTGPAETPASTFFDPRIKQPALVRRDLFDAGTTQGRSRVGYGDLVLINDDGALDGLLEYGFDGRAITIRQGTVGAAYPSGFTTLLVGTMEQPEVSISTVTIKLRDRQAELSIPLQTTKYAGSNALPAGLEGVADLKGKPKPVLYGSVLNISPPCVNTSKLIFQVAAVLTGAACNSIDAVYDRGIALVNTLPLVTRTAPPFTKPVWGLGVNDTGTLYVAGAGGGTGAHELASSPDGITWTSRTTASFGANGIYAVGYGNGLWVVVGEGGHLETSPDGITWTARTSAFGTTAIRNVRYLNGLWVAVGETGKLSTSTDGITWTSRTSAFGTDIILGCSYGKGLYVIVGSGGAGAAGKIATSPNGITWTLRTSPFDPNSVNIYDVAFGNDVFVAIGGASGIHALSASSEDGITWTKRVSGFESLTGTAYRLFWLGGRFYAAAATDEFFGISVDGYTWTMRGSGLTSGASDAFYGIAGFGVTLVAGTNTGRIGSSAPQSTYANQTDLLDDTLAPPHGTFKAYPAGGYFRLGSSPAGTVTADVTQGATAADRTAAQIYKALLIRAGKSSGDYSAGDITALDTANSAVLGFWTDQETTFDTVIDAVLGTVGAWWGPDRTGVFRTARLIVPAGSPVISLTANDLIKAPERISTQDPGKGIPVYRAIVRYAKNYTVQTSDLAAGVDAARREIVGNEWREASYTDASVQTAHLLAPQTDEDSLFAVAADALTEATRRQILRGPRRDRFTITIPLDSTTAAIDGGNVISLAHPRFGLSAGKLFAVIGLAPDAAQRQLALSIWG